MRDVGQETIASEKFDASPGATPSEEARLYRPHAKPFASLCPLLCPNKKIQQIQIQTRKAANQLNSEQEDEPVDNGESFAEAPPTGQEAPSAPPPAQSVPAPALANEHNPLSIPSLSANVVQPQRSTTLPQQAVILELSRSPPCQTTTIDQCLDHRSPERAPRWCLCSIHSTARSTGSQSASSLATIGIDYLSFAAAAAAATTTRHQLSIHPPSRNPWNGLPKPCSRSSNSLNHVTIRPFAICI